MQSNTDIQSHPLYAYASYALEKVSQRFPRGAGNLAGPGDNKSMHDLIKDTQIFISFSKHANPNGKEFAELIADLDSGSADLMVCYAIGALRTHYPNEKTLFNCVYINQNIPGNSLFSSEDPDYSHALLLIGAGQDATAESLFSENPDALMCDIYTKTIFTVKEFHQHQVEEKLKRIIFLLYNLIENRTSGVILYAINTLQGELFLFPYDDINQFFAVLQEMYIRDEIRIARKVTQHITPIISSQLEPSVETKECDSHEVRFDPK